MKLTRRLALLAELGAAITLSLTATFAADLTPLEARGKEIYMRGKGASHSITATLDAGTTRVAAESLPCASCHGNDGRGRAEGGATPSDITFAALHRQYDVTTASGRTHGPYDDRTLRRAIASGVDPAGHRLDAVMPRYSMTKGDLNALLAYLRQLGTERVTGVSENRIVLGVVLPPAATMPEASAETRAVVSAWFSDINTRGGIFGRTVELAFVDPSGTPSERLAALRTFVEGKSLFAFVSSFNEGTEREFADLAEEKQIPFIATITSNPRSTLAPGRYVRELFAGLSEQSRALIRVAAREKAETKHIVILSAGDALTEIRDAALQEARDNGFASVRAIERASLDPATLREQGVDTILVLDSSALDQLLRGIDAQPWRPMLLVPSAVGDPDLLAHAPVPSMVSFPMLPSDSTDSSSALHARLIAENHITTTHRATQTAALASASLVTDALIRAGRNLTRDVLLDAIDSTRAFRSGFAPPLTFRPDRHIGSTGCYIVAFEPGQPAKSAWVEIE